MRADDIRIVTSGTGGWPRASGPLRILHFLYRPASDALRAALDLIEAQQKAGHKTGLVCDSAALAMADEERLAHLAPLLDLGVIRVTMRKEIAPAFRVKTRELAERVGDLAPDILHGHGKHGGFYARTIGTKLRKSGSRVARVYTPLSTETPSRRRSWRSRLESRIERKLARQTDAFAFSNEYDRNVYALSAGSTTRPMAVAPLGLKAEAFAPLVPVATARDFVFVGEPSNQNGLDVFIGALALIQHRSGTAPTAAIVGAGGDEHKYRMVVQQLGLDGAVAFHGGAPNRGAMMLGRTLVVPPRVASIPYPVLDAIGGGMPVIATDVGSVAEIFGGDADTLVPAGNAAALADAMSAALAAPEALLATTAAISARLRAGFTVEAMAETVESLYRAV